MRFIYFLFFTIVPLSAIDYQELYGNWQIQPLKDHNRKVFFSGAFEKNIDIYFQKNAKITINGSSKYYFQLKNNDLLIGKWFQNGKVKGTHDLYRFTSLVEPELSYGNTCYILNPIKLGMGGIKSKDTMKICRAKKHIFEKFKY